MRSIIVALALCLFALDPARAFFPFGGMSAPRTFIPGRLKCAANVNAALAERGIKGSGSNLAKSFLTWGRASGAVPGAVAVYDRDGAKQNGHAAIVSRIERGKVYVWNPTRRGWRETIYPRPAIAYRVTNP